MVSVSTWNGFKGFTWWNSFTGLDTGFNVKLKPVPVSMVVSFSEPLKPVSMWNCNRTGFNFFETSVEIRAWNLWNQTSVSKVLRRFWFTKGNRNRWNRRKLLVCSRRHRRCLAHPPACEIKIQKSVSSIWGWHCRNCMDCRIHLGLRFQKIWMVQCVWYHFLQNKYMSKSI